MVQGRVIHFHKRDAAGLRAKRTFEAYFESKKMEAQTLNEELGRFKEDKLQSEFYKIVMVERELPARMEEGSVSAEEQGCLADRRARLILASYLLDKMEEVFRACKDAASMNLYIHAARSLRANLLTDDYFSKPLPQVQTGHTAASGFLQALSAKTGIEILDPDPAIEAYKKVVYQRIDHRVGVFLL